MFKFRIQTPEVKYWKKFDGIVITKKRSSPKCGWGRATRWTSVIQHKVEREPSAERGSRSGNGTDSRAATELALSDISGYSAGHDPSRVYLSSKWKLGIFLRLGLVEELQYSREASDHRQYELKAKDVLPNLNRTAAERTENIVFVPGDPDLWPLILAFKLVRARDHVFLVKLSQMCSAVAKIFHTQTKNTAWRRKKTESSAVHCVRYIRCFGA